MTQRCIPYIVMMEYASSAANWARIVIFAAIQAKNG
jgi:hypothetical protein